MHLHQRLLVTAAARILWESKPCLAWSGIMSNMGPRTFLDLAVLSLAPRSALSAVSPLPHLAKLTLLVCTQAPAPALSINRAVSSVASTWCRALLCLQKWIYSSLQPRGWLDTVIILTLQMLKPQLRVFKKTKVAWLGSGKTEVWNKACLLKSYWKAKCYIIYGRALQTIP